MGFPWTPRKCGSAMKCKWGFFSDVDHFLKVQLVQYCFYFTSWFSGQEPRWDLTFTRYPIPLHWKAKSSNVKEEFTTILRLRAPSSWLPFLVGRVLTVPGVS